MNPYESHGWRVDTLTAESVVARERITGAEEDQPTLIDRLEPIVERAGELWPEIASGPGAREDAIAEVAKKALPKVSPQIIEAIVKGITWLWRARREGRR
jgi:hypothetical protein